ncbi:uncharacterized protein LOC144178774 isoform X2 [Haemaphysalis longicornis]
MSEAEATLIEGIGDEVLLFGSLSVTLIAVVFAAFYIQPNVQRRRNSQSQRARRDVSPAATGSDHAAGDTAVEDRVQAPQTQLQNDSHAGEPAADEANSAAENGEPPSQQECTQDDTEASQEEVDPDVIRQRRLEFMQRRAGVEVLGSEEAQREQEREGSPPDADGAAAVDPLGDEEEEAGFSIRLKYLNDTERCVRGRPDETVGSFKSNLGQHISRSSHTCSSVYVAAPTGAWSSTSNVPLMSEHLPLVMASPQIVTTDRRSRATEVRSGAMVATQLSLTSLANEAVPLTKVPGEPVALRRSTRVRRQPKRYRIE